MVFRGVYEAPELIPSPIGVLSVANVTKHTAKEYDERWVRRFSQKFLSNPTLEVLTVNDETVSGGLLNDATGDPRYQDYVPFFVQVEDFASTFGLNGEDRFERVTKQLEAATQKAIEHELWEGAAAQAETTANINRYLRKASSVTVPVSGAKKPENALFHLEMALSNSPVGQVGVIHMTADVASALGTHLMPVKDDGEEVIRRMRTRLGTDVIVGYGYTGNGPIGDANAAASATNKWMYATGPVEVHLGKIEIVNLNLAQGIDASINDMRIRAFRPAAVYFDPTVHYAMRVTLPSD